MATPKKDNFATVAEALAGAGTTVLSRLSDAEGSGPTFLTVQQLKDLQPKAEADSVYAGPYTDEADERNSWTAYQGNTAPAAKESQRYTPPAAQTKK